jgi:uncharacterized repeat protein (TIGR01451 family)
VLATVVACLIGLRHAGMQSATLRRITNTTEEGINLNPSISGDGRIIGFESSEDVAAAGGTDHFRAIRANITGDPATFFQIAGSRLVTPAMSQDGSRIAFASRDDLLGTNSDGNSEIFLFDGAKLIQITNTAPGSLANRITNGNFQPSISDDGRFVAFSSNRDLAGQNGDGNLEIFIYDSTANSFAQLTNSSGIVGATDAKISGDGTAVAFIRDNGVSPSTARDLMKQPRSGGSATMLASSVQSLAMTYGRAISDDGARVVYSAETATNTTQVFLFDGRSAGATRQITSVGARVTEVPLHPTISGDGSRIAFAARRTVTGAGSNSDGGVELYVYDFPTATFAKITNATSSATAEIVSSLNDDGSIVAFNFPRVLSGAVTNSGTENNSEIYAIAPPSRPANGTLTAILNDASLGHEPSTTKAVAPNSIAAAQGTNLANTTAQSQRLADGTFPTNVGGTRVTVNGRAAQIFFVSPTQINFLVPSQTEIGTAEVIVTSSENFPSRGTVSILRAAPGIFTKTGDGIGEGIILNAETLQEGPFDPTGGNLRLSIFTTGARNAAVTTVSIGGRVVSAEAVLPSTTMPGLDEVHVRVPADLRGAGTVNLTVTGDGRDSNPVTVSFLGDPSRAILFNEVLADPPNGSAGDANNDGVRDTTDDEFVEFVNGSAAETTGLSGWTVKTRATGSTTETTRFTFPAGTSLAPGAAAVIFGGGAFSPTDPIFGCAQIFRATSASSGLSLTNTGLTILLRDSAGNLIAQFSYGGSTGFDGNNSQSLTRSPDITGSFVLHTTANAARRFSPGLKVDGTPFGACPSHPATVTISPSSTSVNQGQTTQFNAQSVDQFGRAMTGVPITFTSDNPTVATVDSTTTNQATGVVTANVGTDNPGVAHITASATDGTTTVNSSAATLTVVGPALSVNDVSKNEGNAGTTTFTFTVSLSLPAPAGGVRFDIATQDGTATVANNDYVARALTNQVIPAGAQTYFFDVTVNGDTAIEPNENFFVSVSNVSGAGITKGQGTGTIANDDSPTLSISDVSANEGDSGTTKFTFTVTTPVVAEAAGITFDIATADGTANAASGDYLARTLTGQTIPAGQSSYTFDVTVNGDTLVESNETFFVNITNVTGAAVNDSQGQGTVQNDDTPNLVISQIYPGGGLSNAAYTNDFIELYNHGTTTVDFSITPYSAQFLSTTGSTWVKTDLTSGVIGPGRYFLIREVSGGANGSSLPAPDATGTINLTSTTDGKVALVSGTTLLAGSCPGDDGSAPFNPTNVADFVGYGGTSATANHCYEGTGPSAFTLGNNTIADFRKAGGCVDTNDNASDFFTAQPSPRNSSSPIGDCKPEITINDATVTEGNSGTVSATFTVALSATTGQTVKVDFATADGTAAAPSDYQANNGTLTFNPGDLTKTITVLVNGDTMDEPNETFFVNLSNVVNAVILDSQGQGTINDNDAAPSVSINDVAVTEGNSGTTAATFTVTLSAASGFTVTVNYATADNTANAGSDYQSASGTVTFNPGETSKPFSVTVNGDADFEQNESFFVNLSSPVNVTIADGQGIGTINNDDPLPSTPNFFVDDVNISEGDSGTRTANFTVTLNPAAAQQVSVQYATANGTATAGSDYQSASGTLTFDPGETSKPVSVTINGDTLVEPDETFFVNLSNASAGTNLGDPQGTGTIQNDDLANLVISQVYPGGGLSGATYANDFIELYNRANTTVDFSVTPYSIQFLSTGGSTWTKTDLTSGTIAPGHYFLIREASGGAVGAALPAADATGTINLTSTTAGKVALISNTILLTGNCPGDDGTQPFNPTSASIADFVGYLGTSATANHCYEGSGPASFTSGSNTTADFRKAGGCLDTNDNANDFFVAQPSPRNSASPVGDCKPEIVINDVTLTEGNSGTVNATFTVTLTASSAQTVTVDFATADGTATASADYQANNGVLTFAPGDTTKTITVLVNGDTLDEANETFFVNLSNPVNASIVDAQGLGTINDNDPQPSLAINDVSLAEGNSGTTAMNFTVTLLTASGQVVNVNYATADNTATAPSDYQSTSGTVSFNPGETAKQVTVSVNGDPDFEQNETLFVNLSGATNATISDGQGLGTITNDDAAPVTPTFFINDVTISEGDSGTTTASFTVTLSPASGQQTTVDYATANSTASSSSDYQSTSGTLMFGIGETSKQVSVTINGDTRVEPDETFFVNLTNATGHAGIGDAQGVGTIQNDDAANLVISQIYPGGGLANAVYANDYIELFNRGTTTVDFSLTPFSAQFLSTGGSTWAKTDLTTGIIAPGHYFLIKETSGGANGAALPAADATGTINLTSTTSGKVALVSGTTLLTGNCPGDDGTPPLNPTNMIDFVGYGGTAATANHCYEGTGPSSFTLSNNTIADYRKAGGCTDTNDNAADFFASSPFPRNSSSTNNCAGGATPNLSIDNVTVTEGNSGATTATFTVSLSAPAQATDLTFDIATADGTATTANNDYAAKTLTNQVIPAGLTTYSFTVNVNGDLNVESDETFLVNVTNVAGANVANGQGTGTIQNDDQPAISINDVSVTEGNAGTTNLDFTVSLSAPAPATVTFDIATADGTAMTSDSDYSANNLTGQTITAGQQTYHFLVTVNGDINVEPHETLFVNLSNVTGATVADSQGQGTILNDDTPTLSITPTVSVTEGNSGTTNATFTVTLSPTSNQTVTVQYATADGTAKSTSDYQSTSGTLTFDPGDTTKTIDVPVNGDLLVEPDESFTVTLSNQSVNAAISVTNGTGTGTILNDDTAQLVISQLYAAGGNSGATYKNDFIEIFNRGNTTVDFSVTNYSLQYATSAGNFGSTSITNKFNLTSGTIAAHRYFLVSLDGGANGADLPTPDASGSIAMNSTNGKIALVREIAALAIQTCPSDPNIADLVGYGTGPNCFEGSATAPAPGTITADFRKLGGCQDTNDNAADFTTATPNPRNTSSTLNDCSSADLAITKSDSPDPVVSGQNVTYTIVVTNNGPAVASSVVVTDNLPAEVTFFSCNSTGSGVCGGTGNNRTVTFSSLAVGASETITLVATVNVAGGGSISNTASVASSTTDSVSGNNSATATTVVNNPAFADLSLAKTDSPDPVYPTQTLTYAITLTNNGPDAANSVVVTDTLPAGVTFVDCAANQSGVCGGTSTTPTVTFSSLANGATATITIHVTVNINVTAGTVLTNNASVTSTTADSNGGNNSASASTTVQELNAGDLLISEFRTRGPSGAADEFVEIYNPGTSTVVIGGLKIRASNNAGTISDRVTITAGTTLGGGCHYLIANSSASGYSGSTPANQTYTTGITDDGGIAITRNNGTTIIDQVGMSSGSSYKEGTTLTPLAGSANQSYERKPGGANGNGTDTNNNTSDYFLNAATSNPQNSSSGCLNTSTSDLSITNIDSPDPVTVGSDITYTITVTNNGIGPAGSVVVTDNLPSGLTYVSCNSTGGGVCGGTGNNRTVNFSSLSVGASATVTIVGTVNGTGGASISNTATVSSATTDPNNANDSATATTTVSAADLSITNSDSPDPVNAAENITYTLTVTNNSATIPAESVTVSDPLASNTTLVSVGATPAGWTRTDSTAVGANGTITYTRSTLAASGTATFTITAKVDSGAANNSTISNTATVSSNTPDDTPANNSALATTTVRTPADLTLSKSVNNASPNVGDQVTFTITLSNAGPYAATGVLVKDVLPAGLTYVSDDGSGSYTSGTGIWNVGTVNASASATLHITASVTSAAVGGVTNSAEITASDQFDPDSTVNNNNAGEDDQASATFTAKSADLSLTKTVDNALPTVGQNVTFTVTLSNGGPNDATNVQVKDQLPAGLTYVSANPSQGTYTSATGLWVVGTVSTSSPQTLEITATVASSGTITNTAEVTASDVFDPDSTPNNHNAGEDDQASRTISSLQADLSLTKTVNNATPNVGSQVIFTITLTNGGPDDATNVVVKDQLPAGLSFQSATPSQGSYSSSSGNWVAGTVTASSSLTLQITATVTGTGTITNTAEVTASDLSDPDSTVNNHNAGEDDQASSSITPQQADLSLLKSVSNATPDVGNNVTFTITLTNGGPDAATGVSVTDQLPAGLSFQSASPSQGSYTPASGLWVLGTVNLSASATLQITATVTTNAPVTNTATITASDVFDPVAGNNTAGVTVTPKNADLSITKTDSPDPVAVGNDITYTVTVTNAGPAAATSAVLSDTVPANTTFQSISPPAGWTCGTTPAVGGTGAISCTNPGFAVGSGAFTLVVRVGSAVADNTTISNTASISSNTFDPNLGSESATQTTTVRNPAVVISQIYAGGGNTGAQFLNDFVEIFNRTGSVIDISNWSIQTATATGTTWTVISLCPVSPCTIGPNKYYLIRLGSGGAIGSALPTPDATGSTNFAVTGGKAALVNNTTPLTGSAAGTTPLGGATCPNVNTPNVLDFVGFGNATCFEGSTAAPALANTTANFRASSGCTDTNSNSVDFSTAAPNPRNSSSAAHTCP